MENQEKLQQTYENIKLVLEENQFQVSSFKQINYGIQFQVTLNKDSFTIRVYLNKKGAIKYDYSLIKEDNSTTQRIRSLLQGNDTNRNGDEVSKFDLGYPIIGTDESGKGDYFGPLVSAGVYVDVDSANQLFSCGVKDSKQLSDERIRVLADKIMLFCKNRYEIIEITPEKYNSLYEQFKKENKNLNTLLAWGHAKAIEEILSKVECSIAIADQFADESFILGKLQEKGKKLKLVQMPKAENNIAVAAASILARKRFIEKLDKLSQQYGIVLPKGASQEVIEKARILVSKYGVETLRKVAKMHFKTTQEVLKNEQG